MLMAEGEDLYTAMQQYVPTIYRGFGENGKRGPAEYAGWWETSAPTHLAYLENLLSKSPSWPCRFSSTGQTAGELYLWAMLHQMVLVRGEDSLFAATPNLKALYSNTKALPDVHVDM